MSRGLGKIQRKIRGRLRKRSPDPFFDSVRGNWEPVKFEGWHDVTSIAHEVLNDFEVWDDYRKLTESELQLVWRAIRMLEKRDLIQSRMFPIFEINRTNYFGKRWGS